MVINFFAFFWGIGQTIAVALAYAFYQIIVVNQLIIVHLISIVVGDMCFILMDQLFWPWPY